YAEALKSLDSARKIHDRRRFSQLSNAQNPLSDPTEEIFLRACDELRAYWTIEDKLRGGNYLSKMQPDPVKALDDVLKVGAEGTMNKKLVATLTEEKKK